MGSRSVEGVELKHASGSAVHNPPDPPLDPWPLEREREKKKRKKPTATQPQPSSNRESPLRSDKPIRKGRPRQPCALRSVSRSDAEDASASASSTVARMSPRTTQCRSCERWSWPLQHPRNYNNPSETVNPIVYLYPHVYLYILIDTDSIYSIYSIYQLMIDILIDQSIELASVCVCAEQLRRH